MATFRSFEDLEAWKRGFELAKEIYRITGEGALARDFVMRDRLRKASVAVIASIAQGFDQQEEAGFLPFLGQAKGALAEVKALLHLARDLDYLGEADFAAAREMAEAASKMTGGLYHYLKKKGNGKPDGWPDKKAEEKPDGGPDEKKPVPDEKHHENRARAATTA
jgi:four helix bundle protein